MSKPPVEYHELVIDFTGFSIESRIGSLKMAVEFYNEKNGYVIVESWLDKWDGVSYHSIDDFTRDNIAFADRCVFRYVKLKAPISGIA